MKNSLFFFVFWAAAAASFAQPGALDASFGNGGVTTFPFSTLAHSNPVKVLVQPDNKIVAVGNFWIPNDSTPSEIAMARLMPDGTPDLTLNISGKITIAFPGYDIGIQDAALLPDGKILMCGGATQGNNQYIMVARVNSNGIPDPSFDGDGFLFKNIGQGSQYARCLAVQPDGKIVVGGYLYLNNTNNSALLRLQANGAMDNNFGDNGVLITNIGAPPSEIASIELRPDGKIVAGGWAVLNGQYDFAVARFNSNGSIDNSFGNGGRKTINITNFNDRALKLLLQPDGKILLVGYAGSGQQSDEMTGVVRLKSNGDLDPSFGVAGISTFNVNSDHDLSTSAVLQPDGKILLGGHSRENKYRFTIIRMNVDGSPDLSFGAGAGYAIANINSSDDQLYSICLDASGKAVCAGISLINDRKQFGIVRFITGITIDTSLPGAQVEDIGIFPNPVEQEATLTYYLRSSQTVSVDLFDMAGRRLETILPATLQTSGNQHIPIKLPTGLPAGVYLLNLQTDSGIQTVRIVH